MQIDATKADGDNFEQSPNPIEGYIQLNATTANVADESEEEYESWGGFESGMHLVQHHWHQFASIKFLHPAAQTEQIESTKSSAPKKLSGHGIGVKTRMQNKHAGKAAVKRKAPSIAEKYVTSIYIGIHQCDLITRYNQGKEKDRIRKETGGR